MGRNFFEYHTEQMQNSAAYKATFEALEPEFAVAHALITARSSAGLTQSDMAQRMGITQPAIARMESGKNVSIKSLARYAKAVGKSIHLEILPV